MSKKWYNNGEVNIFRDIETPPEGFVEGMLESSKRKMSKSKKGIQTWNKGLSKETDDRVKQISETQKGREFSEEHKRKISEGTKAAMANPNIRKKLSEAKSGKHLSAEHKAKIGEKNRGKVVTDKTKKKMSESAKKRTTRPLTKDELKVKLTRQYLTRKKNNTFNTSTPEEKLYNKLLEEYEHKHIYRQYKDNDRYPFYCDFYIKEDDLFIELNAHWTHGGKPFDPNDSECQEKLKIWQEKAKQSKFYENAIHTWTVRDVEKQKFAKENNLNYKVIY